MISVGAGALRTTPDSSAYEVKRHVASVVSCKMFKLISLKPQATQKPIK